MTASEMPSRIRQRTVEIFSAGCSICSETIDMVNRIACLSCKVSVLDMKDEQVAQRARTLGISSLPAVVIDGRLAGCCAGRGPDAKTLRAEGLGTPLT